MFILTAFWATTLLLGRTSAPVPVQTSQVEVFVSPAGHDQFSGERSAPVATLDRAMAVARQWHRERGKFTIWLADGTYYLDATLMLGPADSGLQIRALPGQHPVLSGGFPIETTWTPFRNGIFRAPLPTDVDTDQLFVNGTAQPLARYPNVDPKAKYFNGVAADVLDPVRVAKWAHPEGAYLHALHSAEWGDVHYKITGRHANGSLTMEGGWQNNRPMGMKTDVRFVEGIFEELDAPGEWYLDRREHVLYYYPPAGVDISSARVEGVKLNSLIELQGTEANPVSDVLLEGLTMRHVGRTFMLNREPLLRSDWTIYRGGALMISGSRNTTVRRCFLDGVGGNAIFVNNFNRGLRIQRTRIENAGANGVAFVGDPKAVRSGLSNYDQRHSLSEIDLTPGPITNNYPSDCRVEDCLIDRTGRIEKQSAPIEISMSRRITVSHCSIYDVPRAGINIGDGCWGGHVIEYCDVFDTVKETGDHGSFNSWGRDRYWGLKDVDLNALDKAGRAQLPLLDAVEPITLRNNRWRCDHGWDIDLDDGSTNFKIVDNLCLNGGLKLREGFHRVCENNVIVNNSFHVHVWFKDSHDLLRHNIVFEPYHVIQAPPPWEDDANQNVLHIPGLPETMRAAELAKLSGHDADSISADVAFVDPLHGDYRVRPGSPALNLGFKNFPMDRFGVVSPELRRLARTPQLPLAGM